MGEASHLQSSRWQALADIPRMSSSGGYARLPELSLLRRKRSTASAALRLPFTRQPLRRGDLSGIHMAEDIVTG
jgi:hypothetical protein